MISFPQTIFKIILAAGPVFALQIEAPKEIEEFLWAYSTEIGAQNKNLILRANNNILKLIDNGKTIREVKICTASLPNIALQNAVNEIFGHSEPKNEGLSGNIKTILIGTGLAAASVLLYYSNTPKPVYGEKK